MLNIQRQYSVFFLIFLFLLPISAFAEEPLSPQVLDTIKASVFEVIVPKPTKDSLTYKDPLPFNSLPFAVRNDHYYSIGTAFAIGSNRFVSAAHVMNLRVESQWEKPQLRDCNGKVYSIDQIVKYSERHDFIVFTLKDCTVATPLEINAYPKSNQRVFAVGNALGEGIVIRDGLYTSDTQEEEEGAWKWLRFSAAASPGNSGGPLLDSTGKVLGIVLKKSRNENLNVALPISEVIRARENMAYLFEKTWYSLPIMTRQKSATGCDYLELPKSYQDLNHILVENSNYTHYTDSKRFFTEMQGQLFPNGPGAKALLASPPSAIFPSLVKMKDDGNWEPQNITTTSVGLGQNGRIVYGEMGGSLVFSLHKPDNVSLGQLYTDGKLFMDLVLRGIRFSRNIGETPVRITSFGSPHESYNFRDYYGRTWLVRTWLREYDDSKLVTFSLPTPDGFITLMRMGQTGVADSFHIPTLKILTNFMFFPYTGTLKEWEEFLRHKEILPKTITSLDISRHDADLSFSSTRFAITVKKNIIPTSDKTLLILMMGYGFDKGDIVWDISSLILSKDQSAGTFLAVSRHSKPDKNLNEEFIKFWETISTGKFPYNRSAYSADGTTRIMSVVESPGSGESILLHTVVVANEGTVSQDNMENKLDNVLRWLTIKDTGFTSHKEINIEKEVLLPYTEYSRIMQEDTKSALRYTFQGDIYLESGDLDSAQKSYDNAIRLDPSCAGAYLGRGLLYAKHREFKRALDEYSKAIELDRFNHQAFNNRGSVFINLKQYGNAIIELNKALEINQKLLVAYDNRAIAYQEINNYDGALSDRNRIVDIDPNNYDGYYNRGKLYRQMKDSEKALIDFDRAIKIKDKFARAYFERGSLYVGRGDFSKAIDDFTKVIEIEPRNFGAYIQRGVCLTNKGDQEKAIADYSMALKIDPKNVDALSRRGHAYASQGNPQMALDDLNRALTLAPDNWYAHFARGIAYGRKGALTQSLDDFNRAAELEPKNPDIYISRGFSFFQKKDFNRALVDYNRALEINPKAALAYQNRGNLYAHSKDMANACSDWKHACELGTCTNFIKAQKLGICQ